MPNIRRKNIKKLTKLGKNSKSVKKVDKSFNKSAFDKKRKNFKFIKRSKEAEEAQRRQKIVEDRYKKQNVVESISDDNYDEEDEENPLEQLISTFKPVHGRNTTSEAIESATDSEEESVDSNVEPFGGELSDVEELDEQINDEEVNSNSSEEEDNENTEPSDEEDRIEEDLENKLYESDNEKELDDDIEKTECLNKNIVDLDPFTIHLENELSPEHIDNLLSKPQVFKKSLLIWPELGNLQVEISKSSTKQCEYNKIKKQLLGDVEVFANEGENPKLFKGASLDLNKLHVKNQIISSLGEARESTSKTAVFTPLQFEIFTILNNYQDLFYSQRTFSNAEDIRYVYCLHAINHMLKTRTKILHHNAKISAMKNIEIIPDIYRDQGLVRPKILIILPFRDSAFRTINLFVDLLFGKKTENAKKDGSIINYKRFVEEYTGDSIRFPKTTPKPDDYELTFSGNTDDTFRIGISFTKKCMKLYTEFYSSDILLVSPLGLRMIIGASGDKDRDYDFLNSIELLILDQAELFLAQNWDHLLHVLDHLHLQPQSVKNTDFSRVRPWCLNGFSRFYRQTLLFTSHELPEFRSLFNSKCSNYRGKVKSCNPIHVGTIRNVITEVPQVFHKIEATSIQSSFDTRFNYFINEILPQYKSPSMAHCMIYVPSYFDYVRLRNYFKSESINFVQICEYTKDSKIARARDMFFHSSAHFLLYSERAHFFRRTRIKGIRHLIMYQPPIWPNFYSEIINLMQNGYQNPRDGLELSMTVTILYTKYDMLQISSIIGSESASKMLKSGKTTHLFTTGE